MWKAIIVAWITITGQPPTFVTLEREARFASEAACEAKLKADAAKIEGMLENIIATQDGELLSHITACVEDQGGQVT